MTKNTTLNVPSAPNYGSDQFASEFARILGVSTSAVASAAKTLFPNGSEQREPPLDASEIAELICGCLAERSRTHVVDTVDVFSGMEFQFEFGPEGTSDSRWHPRPRDHHKAVFGTQLSAILESAGARDDDRTGVSPAIRAGLSLGWTPSGSAVGLLQFDRPQRRVTFLYSSDPVLTTLRAGVRVSAFELETSIRLDVDPARLQHLARVMRDLRQSGMQSSEPLPGNPELENAMWRQGWGLLRDSDGAYQIVRVDADRRFASDDEATQHVESLAAMGEPLHEQAMRFHPGGGLEPESTASP